MCVGKTHTHTHTHLGFARDNNHGRGYNVVLVQITSDIEITTMMMGGVVMREGVA